MTACAGTGEQQADAQVWGYLCHLQATHTVLLIVYCCLLGGLDTLKRHNVFNHLREAQGRCVGLIAY